MKDLKEYIKEGLFDDVDKLEGKKGLENNFKLLKNEIIDWILNHTAVRVYKNKLSVDMNTNPPTVDYNGNIKLDKYITSLTNDGMFQWGEVRGSFYCTECKSLKSLEGSPKYVGGDFDCENCKLLTTLKGAPKEVEMDFNCTCCTSLTSLKGAPEKVGGSVYCSYCNSLKTLEGAPKEVGRRFYCRYCGTQFTIYDVKKVSNVNVEICC
jgi:hypothetical protein